MPSQLAGPGLHEEGHEANWSYSEHVGPSRSTEFAGNPDFRKYVVADANHWYSLSDVVYEDLDRAEESDFLPDGEGYLEPQRKLFKSLQLVADEVDDMPKKTVGPQQCFCVFHQDSSQQCACLNPDHVGKTGPSSQIETVPGTNAVHYTVQNTSLTYEMEANHPTQHEVGPSTSFRRSLDQGRGAHHVPVLQSSSKSQPRRPTLRDMGYDSLAFPVQEYVGCEWNCIEHKGYGNFTEAPGERSGGRFADDWQEQSTLRPLRTIQRSYFPPNLLPTEKMKYLLVNYKNACARYFPFANKTLLESDTRYRPVEPVASDLFRFHSRGAHIHGFFRTVIDSRDPPHPDQTRYIQDIQFGKVFPLIPGYDQWDDSMRSEFRKLSNRLMQLFEGKCFYANRGNGHGQAPVIRRGPKRIQKPPPDYAEQQRIQYEGVPRGFRPLRSSIMNKTKLFATNSACDSSFTALQCQGPVRQAPTDSQSFHCRKPDDFWKTLRHKRSTASETIRAPAADDMRRPVVLTEYALNTTTSSTNHFDHSYRQSHSSGRRGAPTSNYSLSTSIRRPVTRRLGTSLIDDQGCISSEQTLDGCTVEDTPLSASGTEVADENQVAVRQMQKCSWSLMSKSQYEYSDQCDYTTNFQRSLGSSATSTQKPLKEFGLMRDEHERLSQLKRSQDGTFHVRDRPCESRTSQLCLIPPETRSDVEVHKPRPPNAGTFWDVQFTSDKRIKMEGSQGHQWRNSGTSRSGIVESQEHDDENCILDIATVYDGELELKNKLLASVPHSRRKKAGRPPKKCRGRLAKQNQAIRNAVRAEKLAIKQREFPVLDLILKCVENPTVKSPLEAFASPFGFWFNEISDSSIIHDPALLHEVGELLKQLVLKISLEELRPKRVKKSSRRC